MEDKVIKTSFYFVDTDTGEIFSKGNYCVPLSLFHDDSLSKYVQSFLRGVRLDKPVAVEIVLSVVKPADLQIPFDFDEPVLAETLKHVHESSEDI